MEYVYLKIWAHVLADLEQDIKPLNLSFLIFGMEFFQQDAQTL